MDASNMRDTRKRRKVTASDEARRFLDIEAELDNEEENIDEWSSDSDGEGEYSRLKAAQYL